MFNYSKKNKPVFFFKNLNFKDAETACNWLEEKLADEEQESTT
ncbi:MAG: hypothetical protein ACI81T_002859 [Bacteroidia bacterium]